MESGTFFSTKQKAKVRTVFQFQKRSTFLSSLSFFMAQYVIGLLKHVLKHF